MTTDIVTELREGMYGVRVDDLLHQAADEIERLQGTVSCLTGQWPDCNVKNCGQPCRPPEVMRASGVTADVACELVWFGYGRDGKQHPAATPYSSALTLLEGVHIAQESP